MNELTTINNYDTTIATLKDYDIYLGLEYINNNSEISTFFAFGSTAGLSFEQTKATLSDLELYKKFIENSIRRFRRSRSYKGYKAHLMNLGMDRCQLLGHIDSSMAEIEMHHNFLNIHDIAILITNHIINTVGKITTFDLIMLLAQEHRSNNIPIVMLSTTAHQVYHDNPDFYIPQSMTFGTWWELLAKYRFGITIDIANKVMKYLDNCSRSNEINNSEYFRLRHTMESWGIYNQQRDMQFYRNNYGGLII